MGADFLLYCCEDPVSYTKAKPAIDYRIDNLNNDEIDKITDDVLWYETEEIKNDIECNLKEEDLYKLDDLWRIKAREVVKARLRGAVEELIGDDIGWRRDIAHMQLDGVNYIFSGGMSWGDEPSEACAYIDLINASGIFIGMGSESFDYNSFKA